MKRLLFGLFLIGIAVAPLCAITGSVFTDLTNIKKNYVQHKADRAQFLAQQEHVASKAVTIFVHGSYFPWSWVPFFVKTAQKVDIKNGLHHALDEQYAHIHGQIPKILNKEARDEFPIENFYFFGWSGNLNHADRVKAGQQLYAEIKKIKSQDPQVAITLIGHSHGATITLLTALEAKNQGDHDYTIERLILLAMPVQVGTQHLALDSSIFKHVFLNYSYGDWMQRLDLQGLFAHSPSGTPLFSKRSLPAADHVKQAAIVNNHWKVGHFSFAFDSYIKNMPQIIKMMQHMNSNGGEKTINITPNGPAIIS